MTPASTGLMAGYGFLNHVFQFVAFPHTVERFGPRPGRVFISFIKLHCQHRRVRSDVPDAPVGEPDVALRL